MAESAGTGYRKNLGARGEDFAVAYLERRGYRIIARDWLFQKRDLDIVAYDTDAHCLVFVEVKTRRDARAGEPEEAVTPSKMRNIITCSLSYMKLKGAPENIAFRYDVIGIKGTDEQNFELRHVENAFNGTDAFFGYSTTRRF